MSILSETLDDIVHVEDEQIAQAMVLLAERTKFVVEGAGAVGIAALLSGVIDGSGPALALLSGGNIDASLMVQVMRRGLALSGRYLVLRTQFPDQPGELAKLLDLLAAERVNVVEVEHKREAAGVPVGYTGVELTLLTRDSKHCDQLVAQMGELGLPGRAARLTRCFDELPGLIEARLREHARVVLIYFDAFGWRFLERHAGHPLFAAADVERWSSMLPVHDDRPRDDHPLRPSAGRARPVRMERLRAAPEPARHAPLVRLRR